MKKPLCGRQVCGVNTKKEGSAMKESLQTIHMCIQTYLNLYGRLPSVQELTRQLGPSNLQLIKTAMNEHALHAAA